MANGDINIERWARELGFEGVNNTKFQESWKKLVPPSMRSQWRHIITHVLPAEKVNYIRKYCLLAKLELLENQNQKHKIPSTVKSSKDYEEYKQKKSLLDKLEIVNNQNAEILNEIKDLWLKLESKSLKQNEVKEKEEDKLMSCKILKAKRKTIIEDTNKFKEIQNIMDYYLENPTEISFIKNDDRWGNEVIEHYTKLPKGEVFKQSNEKLHELLQTPLEVKADSQREVKDLVLQKMHKLHLSKVMEAAAQRKKFKILMNKLQTSKNRFMQRFSEQLEADQVRKNFQLLLDLNVKDVLVKFEVEALENLQNSQWKIADGSSKTEQYLLLRNEISKLEARIESKTKEIVNNMSGQDKILEFCRKSQQAIKEEARNVISKIDGPHEKLILEMGDSDFILEEVKLFLKIPSIRKNLSNNSELSTLKTEFYDCMKKKKQFHEFMSKFKFKPPSLIRDAENDITSFKLEEMNAEKALQNSLERMNASVKDIQKLKADSLEHMEFWRAQPLAEGLASCSEEYIEWRKRCKEVMDSQVNGLR